jgi:hypothetical protein
MWSINTSLWAVFTVDFQTHGNYVVHLLIQNQVSNHPMLTVSIFIFQITIISDCAFNNALTVLSGAHGNALVFWVQIPVGVWMFIAFTMFFCNDRIFIG